MTDPDARRAPARTRIMLIALAALAAGGAALVASREPPVAPPPASSTERPKLLLLSGLPIVFGEQFGLEGQGSPALAALEKRYRVEPIALADAATLQGHKLLLMAQPRAQPAEALVDLDRWVRSGGRLLLLADPLLEWPSERPLGDVLRPPVAFADTGLLNHWGLTLYLPDERGPKQLAIGRFSVLTASPGSLEGTCAVAADGLVARCAVGRGRATVIADADFLNVADLDGPTQRNLDSLIAELAALESSDSQATGPSTDLSTGQMTGNRAGTSR